MRMRQKRATDRPLVENDAAKWLRGKERLDSGSSLARQGNKGRCGKVSVINYYFVNDI